ncbi:hypothetical protein [Agrobacterium vitis]|uniref:Ankyrin repeat domain-containing protein n=1 Tax=Agrobacterium vitis TaxID=373 RepID=A0A7K1RE58_AGRVI|nr:hypothetical protein [Agrobacterium vitis]MVA56270.1 hypothetical protein [Agrobacterium vitis]
MTRRAAFISFVFCALLSLGAWWAYNAVSEYFMEPTYTSDRLFKPYGEDVYRIAQKIERGQPISADAVKDLPGGVNARYGEEITLLFHAVGARNVAAIDTLLGAGADPYMVDRPSTGSTRDFVFVLTLPGNSTDPNAGFPFINQLITLYLKHGGDPNRRLQGSEKEPLISGVALIENYEGFKILLKAGADPWATDGRGNSAIDKLTLMNSEEERKQINHLIDERLFNGVALKQLRSFMRGLSGYEPRGDEITRENQEIGIRILA